jgi:hypothetical protein
MPTRSSSCPQSPSSVAAAAHRPCRPAVPAEAVAAAPAAADWPVPGPSYRSQPEPRLAKPSGLPKGPRACQGRDLPRPGPAKAGTCQGRDLRKPGPAKAGTCESRNLPRPGPAKAGTCESPGLRSPGLRKPRTCRGRDLPRSRSAQAEAGRPRPGRTSPQTWATRPSGPSGFSRPLPQGPDRSGPSRTWLPAGLTGHAQACRPEPQRARLGARLPDLGTGGGSVEPNRTDRRVAVVNAMDSELTAPFGRRGQTARRRVAGGDTYGDVRTVDLIHPSAAQPEVNRLVTSRVAPYAMVDD